MPINNALTPEGANALGAAFGYYPQLRRQGQKARELALARDVNTLPDPRTYAVVSGFLGEAPDEMGFSVLHPDYQGIRDVADPAYALGVAAGVASAVARPVTMATLEAARLARQAALAGGRTLGPTAAGMAEGFLQRQGLMPGVLPAEGRAFQYPQEEAIGLAQQRAMQIGESTNPQTRMLQQGFEGDWYHGGTGDVTKFRTDLLGETTGAASAKKGFFFARDPQNPPEAMLTKTTDQASINMLKKLGKTDEEIASLNKVSMQGYGAETASGYAEIGGSREYKDAMRKANSAEKRKDWNEYEKQMQIAEDSETKRMNYGQSLVAKYGDARDTMTQKVNETFYSLQHPQAQAELLDKKYKELMPYGWYNMYDDKQFNNLKNEITKLVGKDAAAPALKEIDKFKSVKNERALIEKTQEGGNVMPVALRYKNPLVHDFQGAPYRDQSYSDLVDKALAGGHDALILKNTFDPGGGPAKLVDVGVMFSPEQIRSRFAAFDPLRKTAAVAAAAGLAAPDLLAKEDNSVGVNKMRKLKANK
jgi:hypothetical protein